MLFLLIILVVLFMCFSFLFSLSETALIALNKIRLQHLVSQKKKHAELAQKLIRKSDKLITTILIGNNFVNIAISAIVTAIAVSFLGEKWGVVIATFAVTMILLIFCEITPKLFAIQRAEKVSLAVAPLMNAIVNISEPFIRIFTRVSNFIIRIFGGSPTHRSPLITEEELRLMIEVGKEEGVLSDEERKMLHRIFEFGDIKAGDVMVSKDEVAAVDIKASTDELLEIFVEEGHARLPVYQGSIENIVGIIYARDLLYLWRNKQLFVIEDIVHPAYYVGPNMRVNDLLREFQAKKIQIAVIADEKKRALGIVTLEDLVEEIVGEIEEELNEATT